MTLQMKRRSEVFETILDLAIQARAACGALVRGGWRGKPFWAIQIHHARAKLRSLSQATIENRLFLSRELESKLLRFHDRMIEACDSFEKAIKIGRDSIKAHEAMLRARTMVSKEGAELQVGIERRMTSVLANREDIYCLGS